MRCEVIRGVLIRGKAYAEGAKGRVGGREDMRPGDEFSCSFQEYNEMKSAYQVKDCAEDAAPVAAAPVVEDKKSK